jgi:crotonobetaine/carnitine-CoA ligase
MHTLKLEPNIGSLVEKAASRYGDKTALTVDHENAVISFRELNKRANQLANAFSYTGVKPGAHVGVMLPNGLVFPCVWLALAKLGAVMVPINTRYKALDLEYVLADSEATALVIHASLLPIFENISADGHGVRKLYRVGHGNKTAGVPLEETAAGMPKTHQSAGPDREDLMNIQYTSGTTGFAKGVMTTHEYWLSCGVVAASLGFGRDEVFLSMSPFYYMDPQWELIMALTTGGSMVMAEKISGENFVKCINKYPITVSWGSEDMLYLPRHDAYSDYHLRWMLLSACPPKLHQALEEHFNVVAREAYGMTEIGPGIVMPREDTHMVGSGSVGKPVSIREFRIVDPFGNDVHQGDTGELLVQGPGILKGYYKKPEATEKAFFEGYFRTGDLFRQDENGYYYFVGRIKDMIRRMGDNISAEEVEMVLMSHPKIKEAAVVGVPDTERDEEVKAYVIPAPGVTPQTLNPEEIVDFCLERIAKFKVPRYIEFREDFPRSASDKVQKQVLLQEKDDPTAGCFDRFGV